MKKYIYLFFALTLLGGKSIAQTVEIDFSAASNKKSTLYYFFGSQIDSINTQLDTSGKATLVLPKGNYRGNGTLVVTDFGFVEMIIAEPKLKVYSSAPKLARETVQYPDSKENAFYSRVFRSQAENLPRHGWLSSGLTIYDPSTSFAKSLQEELTQVDDIINKTNKEVDESPLFAARYYRLVEYMSRLNDAVKRPSPEKQMQVSNETETTLDIVSLYSTGQMWNSVHENYLKMFGNSRLTTSQTDYAHSIITTFKRLKEPYSIAYLSASLHETERYNWREAQNIILDYVIVNNPNLRTTSKSIDKMIRAYKMQKSDKPAPRIVGLQKSAKSYDGGMLVVFFDSDCPTCNEEINKLINKYSVIEKKNIRIVSIAADENEKKYYDYVKKFPWIDKICDFKGMDTDNFNNFNVVSTPTFYLIDKDGKLVGQYYMLNEIEFLR